MTPDFENWLLAQTGMCVCEHEVGDHDDEAVCRKCECSRYKDQGHEERA